MREKKKMRASHKLAKRTGEREHTMKCRKYGAVYLWTLHRTIGFTASIVIYSFLLRIGEIPFTLMYIHTYTRMYIVPIPTYLHICTYYELWSHLHLHINCRSMIFRHSLCTVLLVALLTI